ncbi:uncharacterized protein BXZ73DRAFT_92022 [Epithele typhae]|uniref:uncharacterized protein n=1 Tax=Epithele typhae TaxID=378194 RepID=UPI002008A4A5|nr:uncharacterized protein BXZ73DRAFT_92022 [Epithele typhae]KAH9920008.1 hypothetical protein BXZ73DRAFT_92022 [Epithele typhae]
MAMLLHDVPEELLERILALLLVQSPDANRPSWHAYASSPSPSSSTHPTIISPLLVCRKWLRIGTPIHYRSPVLRTPRHVELFFRAIRHAPSLALAVRALHIHATSPALRDVVPYCKNLDTLDITVDNGESDGSPSTANPARDAARDRNVIAFCEAFSRTRSIRNLIVRKNAYLTQPGAIYVFEHLAAAIAHWPRLESVNVAFRLSLSPAATALVKALAVAPRLHTVYTHLPAVWNTLLLDISENPGLSRVVLSPSPEQAGAHLFVAQARAHPRLMTLIHAGTPPPPQLAVSAASMRARAASAAVPSKPILPVATWGYEREVPPRCARPRLSAAYPAGPSGPAYGAPSRHAGPPSAYGHAQPQYYQQYHGQHLHPYAVPEPVPQGALVASHARRNAPGARRMTAS